MLGIHAIHPGIDRIIDDCSGYGGWISHNGPETGKADRNRESRSTVFELGTGCVT
jgi:hypothetical protein